jgi:VWFA-related protein
MHNIRRRSVFGSLLPASVVAGAVCVAGLWATILPVEVLAQSRERTMYVSVLDRDEKPIKTLQPEDITIREDNAAREILRIVPATDPMQIAVLVDNSQAATQRIQRMRDALTTFVNKVGNGTNEISIVTMADRATLLLDTNKDAKAVINKGVNRLFAVPGSGMYLLDSITQTTKGFQKRETPRPVIVAILTEGVEFSQDHYQTVLDSLQNSGTAFYALVLTEGPEANPSSDESRNRNIVLDRGTKETGGRRETLITDMALQDNLMSVADELLTQFKVTYSRPEQLIPPKNITVEAKAAGVTARGTVPGPRDVRASRGSR